MDAFLTIVAIGLFVAFFVTSQKIKLQQRERYALDSNDLERIRKRSSAISYGGGAAIWGAIIGSFFGVAGFGSAISGMIPCAVIFGLIAFLAKNQAS